MNAVKRSKAIVRLQWLIWIAVFLIIFFSLLPEEGVAHALIFSTTSVAFYTLVIYGNILVLFPKLWERGHKVEYVICVIVLLIGGGLGRGYLVIYLANHFVLTKPETMDLGMALNFIIAGVLNYMLSFVFRIAIAYFTLKQQAEEILLQKSQAELNLLKSQVQPHFLFNTLNNIYYEAYREAPRTAGLIERLSDIMRYFVDESPKDEVSMQTEVSFIENYIALEKIRIRHKTDVNFVKEYNAESRIPPMLLMTFVENIFKHGIDKSSKDNKVDISLIQQEGNLLFQTCNRIHEIASKDETHGFGIENLRKRLAMLYGEKFELNIVNNGQTFTAFLKVPIAS
ncbi:MAG TPA: histidine kinase [Mucilaginibacter sp.]|jgi:sensor histidine kinase YesM|nr:histidine kinase [Mucilaginibacter sp.]